VMPQILTRVRIATEGSPAESAQLTKSCPEAGTASAAEARR
jgi:hypothetical protein